MPAGCDWPAPASDVVRAAIVSPAERPGATVGHPVESYLVVFETPGFEVGVWSCTPGTFPHRKKEGEHEAFTVLSGRGSITGSDGRVYPLAAGAVMTLPASWEGVWQLDEVLRKVYVTTRAADRPASRSDGPSPDE